MRIIILGNAGVGKTTMARRLIRATNAPFLSLDEIAFEEGASRKPLEESIRLLREFINGKDEWVIEGCYADIVEAALPHCTELRFLNPGVVAAVAQCKQRSWEPEKFPTPEAQDEMLAGLLEWVRDYETREDEYGLKRHRKLFDQFAGTKREYTTAASYAES